MKKILIALCLAASFGVNAQTEIDYSLGKTGEYVLGVYVFYHSTPVQPYDFVGKIKKVDLYDSDNEEVLKIISKAKKKNAYFDGMIVKKEFDHIELIKFQQTSETLAGFKVGDKVNYKYLGKLIQGEIVQLDTYKEKVTIKYLDETNTEKLDVVKVADISKVQ